MEGKQVNYSSYAAIQVQLSPPIQLSGGEISIFINAHQLTELHSILHEAALVFGIGGGGLGLGA